MVSDRSVLESFNSGFNRAASLKPGKPLLTAGREVLTYGQFLDRSARLARVWSEAGLCSGDRVVLATRDDVEAATMFLALLRSGLTAVVIDPHSPAPAAHSLIEAADARGIVLDHDLRRSWQPDHRLHVLEIHKTEGRGASLFNKLLRQKSQAQVDPDSYPALLERHAPLDPPDDFPEDQVAYILFTSGTTSKPKGVQITRRNLVHHLGTLSRQYGYGPDCRILNVLPLHHTDGMTQGPTVAFWNGASVCRPVPFTIPNIGILLDTVYAERITHFVAVPTMLALLLKFGQDFRDSLTTADFRFVISAAAQLEPELWSQFEEEFRTRVCNLYGLTETVTGGLFSGPSDRDHRIGTVGKPVDCEARIVDSHGEQVPCGEAGELLLRGDHVMCGYLNNSSATAEVLNDGWLHTGDIATCDADGFYRIVGRKKNIIITGGLNVHPEEVTEVLNTHPHVLEACTFSVPDLVWGERVESAVALDGQLSVSSTDLVAWCREYLSPAKVPHRIYLLPELPKGPSGKVVIAQTRELALKGGIDGLAGGADLHGRLFAIAACCFNAPPGSLVPSAHPGNTPGWDSLAHLLFVVELEEAFGIRLAPRDIMRIASLHEAERIVREKQTD
jgi:long-chain acyl-CoA synthetase